MEASQCEVPEIYKKASQESLPALKQHEEQELVHKSLRNEGRWTKQLAFVAFGSTIGAAVPSGYFVGVMNSPAEFMRSWCNQTLIERYDWHLTETGINILWSTIVSIFLVGGAIGSLTGAKVANRFGRRSSFLSCGGLFIIGAVLLYTCRMLHSVEALILARFLVGLAAGLVVACLPMYLAEVAPLSMRGVLGVFCPMGLTAGVVVAQILSLRSVFGNAEQWHLAMSLYVVLVLICYAPMAYYPESPKWLYVIKGDEKGARRQLKALRGDVSEASINREMAEMEVEANVKDQVSGYGPVLADPKLRLPLIIVCAYQGGQQLSGINAIFYYSVSIFLRAGLTASAAELTNLGAGSLNLVVSLMGPYLMGRFNRRPLMLFSTFCCCIALMAFSLFLYFIDYVPWFANGCIICIFLYIFFFQFGLAPIPFFIGSELFEVAPRPVAMSLGSVSSWVCNFSVGMLFPILQDAWGSLVFIPFSVVCAALFILTKRYLPETKGRDPSQVVQLVAKGFKSNIRET
ncbi:PREDICTED: solute carrier family 2, facilitated glucose transporter member 1-like [Rhagoletis zephyria]|uniref:solute carrier family 2, facilitated glucose transporter member 1-like n=1 Tax=Rhagoletis zephyria TaxID=28612 RepID=UPI0008118D56|nr:PREDICTED: solute carrier family 2, facilitated glucose transporter member 1-like [Rhagoletis zephyria]